jgi:hypothetical protein
MPTLATIDAATDVPGVLERMAAIDAALPAEDGVAYFNRLYRKVTEEVLARLDSVEGFEDEQFLGRLDVHFANLYFAAVAADARGETAAPAWQPLFEERQRPSTAPVQFALAGMNAHINHDLSVAVVDVCRELALHPARETPQYRDFDRTNVLLEHVQSQIKDWFAVGLIAAVDDACGKVDDALAMWSITTARAVAWGHAETLWSLQDNPHLLRVYRNSLERIVRFAGRGLLL